LCGTCTWPECFYAGLFECVDRSCCKRVFRADYRKRYFILLCEFYQFMYIISTNGDIFPALSCAGIARCDVEFAQIF